MANNEVGSFVDLTRALIVSSETEEAVNKNLLTIIGRLGHTFTEDELDQIENARLDRLAHFNRMNAMGARALDERFAQLRAMLKKAA